MKFLVKLIIFLLIVVAVGGGIYYIMDYNKDETDKNDFIESTKEFTDDVFNKTKKKVDSSKTIQDFRKDMKE